MSLRSMWKGHIKVSLLSVPVKVFSAINSSEKIAFNQLHKSCGNRINQKSVCLTCIENARLALDAAKQTMTQREYEEKVASVNLALEPLRDLKTEDLIKGFEVEKGKFITFTQAEIDSIKVESTHTIHITTFVPSNQLNPLLLDSPYYVAPEDKNGFARQAFGTLQQAFGERIGLGKLQIRDREYIVSLRATGKGLVMHTMLRTAELRSMDLIDELNVDFVTNPDEVAMAGMLVSQLTKPTVNYDEFKDEYTESLRKMIDAKRAGVTYTAQAVSAPAPAINLMEALKASLRSAPAAQAAPQMVEIPPVPIAVGRKKTAKATLKPKVERHKVSA